MTFIHLEKWKNTVDIYKGHINRFLVMAIELLSVLPTKLVQGAAQDLSGTQDKK